MMWRAIAAGVYREYIPYSRYTLCGLVIDPQGRASQMLLATSFMLFYSINEGSKCVG